MSQADADRAVAAWTGTYKKLQAELTMAKDAAAIKSREVADSGAKAVAKFSLWSFVAFLLGALAATWGGHQGAKCATKREESTLVLGAVPATST